MDDFGIAGVAAIGAILKKRVFKGMSPKKEVGRRDQPNCERR